MRQKKQANWIRVGWQGLSFFLPEDWNIGAIGGDQREGYLRYDDPDMPRLEIKWAEAGQAFVDLEKIVEKYLREISKGKKPGQVQSPARLPGKHKIRGKKNMQVFAWRSERQGWGAAWFCPDCHRTLILQVTGQPGEPVAEWTERILAELEDHPREDWILWSAYGFDFYSPRDFGLAHQKLMAGLIEIGLARGEERLHVARWGMANVLLKRQSLEEWGRRELAKRLKRYETTYTYEPHRGHEAIRIAGRTTLPQEKFRSFVAHVRGAGYPDRVHARLWHCPQSNKVFYVECLVDRANVGLLDEVVARIVCHTEGEMPHGEQER